MKRKDIISQIKSKPEADLEKELSEYREKLWTLKTDLAAGKVKNVREIRTVKRNIARMLTMLTINNKQ